MFREGAAAKGIPSGSLVEMVASPKANQWVMAEMAVQAKKSQLQVPFPVLNCHA